MSMSLLRTNNKLAKGDRYLISGLTLAPHGLSGHQVCDHSTIACRAACNLWFAGQRVTPQARARALADTRWLFSDRAGFMAQLRADIVRHIARARKLRLRPLVRLNVASDLDWREFIAEWPECTFYDYTKVRSRFREYLAGELPENYHLTYSASERSHGNTLSGFLRRGGNVAAVCDVDYYPAVGRIGELPDQAWLGGRYWPVIDGDQHDYRLPWEDGRSRIIGLRLKGTNAAKQRARKLGFAWAFSWN